MRFFKLVEIDEEEYVERITYRCEKVWRGR